MFLGPSEYLNSAEARDRRYSREEAESYTSWLAHSHYENFHVVSFLLPKRLHQDFYNVYGFCRWADDLGDEIGDPQESLRLLAWWRDELNQVYEGKASHPVFVALSPTIERHQLPKEPFDDLIKAFEQDQRVNRYQTFNQLYDYCRFSANPVGRLVLYLCGYRDEQRQSLSDATCTALQLANFWQDVAVDLRKDRIYIPRELLDLYHCDEAVIWERKATPEFRAAMREAVGQTRTIFEKGLPLSRIVDRRLAVDLELFSRGGMRILDKIAQLKYDVLTQRPRITRAERVWLLLRTLTRIGLRKAA